MKCASCLTEARDMAQCSICMKCFDFNCAGITESGFRKLGDRKITWKCPNCKSGSSLRPTTTGSPSIQVLQNPDSEMIMTEIRKLSQQITALSTLAQDIKSIKEDIQQLKNSVEYAHRRSVNMNHRRSVMNQRIADLEDFIKQKDQADRLNNAEVKGIPFKESENLFDVVSKLGAAIGCNVAKTEINYVVRVPTRIDPKKKNIIISFNNRYHKENFVACSRSHKNLSIADIGFDSDSKIFINDHLTLENKKLLNKAKQIARDHGYSYIWVKNCKIFLRKDQTSPIKYVKSELDLKKL
ncbi:hypothetical protein ACJJTC_011444 [Scirpophaga incertulas]